MGTAVSRPTFGSNICLNPQFSTVLPGTHTSAIQQNNVASTTQNTEMPGWRTVTGTGSPDITVTHDTATVLRTGDEASLKFVTTTLGSSVNRVECPLIEGEAPAIDSMIWSARNKTLTFAADVKQSAATASASRIGIITDGTGGTTTYSDYHGANTNVERLLATVTVPSDASFVKLALFVENATPDVNLGNCMAVSSDAALSSLAFVPRGPMHIVGNESQSGADVFKYSTPVDTDFHQSDSATFADTPYDQNGARYVWATHELFQGFQKATSTVNGNWIGYRYAGSGATVPPHKGLVGANGDWRGNQFFLTIGQDGQFEFKVSDTNIEGRLIHIQFMGDAL